MVHCCGILTPQKPIVLLLPSPPCTNRLTFQMLILNTSFYFGERVVLPIIHASEQKRGENYLAENHSIAGHGRRAVLLQLVATGVAATGGGERGFLHTDPIGRVYLPLDGWRVDVPPAEEQSHG